jgi:hypothetical protein
MRCSCELHGLHSTPLPVGCCHRAFKYRLKTGASTSHITADSRLPTAEAGISTVVIAIWRAESTICLNLRGAPCYRFYTNRKHATSPKKRS